MDTQQHSKEDGQKIRQPLTPEEVSSEQKAAHREALDHSDQTLNPGDVRHLEKPVEEKAQQVAVDTADITGDLVVVPTYFVVDDPEEEQKALHHVDDAEEISDVIRQARVNEEGERTWR